MRDLTGKICVERSVAGNIEWLPLAELLVTSNGYLWQTNIIIENGRDVLLYCLLTTSYGRQRNGRL
jgi:hypothetical protein